MDTMEELADLLEECVLAAQEVYHARHGRHHPEPWKLLEALEVQEDGVLALGGRYAEEWDEEMFRAAERVFRGEQ